MRRIRTKLLATIFAVAVATFATASYGFTVDVSAVGTNSSDAYANGTVVDQVGSIMGNWSLTTTVANTDFLNDAVQGGPNGVQYVMINSVGASTDSNRIRFDVTPTDPLHHSNITVSQSPYHDLTTWNGGDSDTSRFYLTWNDTVGSITISDPNNQLATVADGQTIADSPALIQFASNRVFNSNDNWSINLPPAARSAELEWSSANPSPGSTLTREWVTFNSDVKAAVAVPEPASCIMLFFGWVSTIGFLRRKK